MCFEGSSFAMSDNGMETEHLNGGVSGGLTARFTAEFTEFTAEFTA